MSALDDGISKCVTETLQSMHGMSDMQRLLFLIDGNLKFVSETKALSNRNGTALRFVSPPGPWISTQSGAELRLLALVIGIARLD